MLSNEEQALVLCADKKRLRAMLKESLATLATDVQKRFKGATFDFLGARLVGDGCALQWKPRPRPNEPESYGNQQTNRGCVVLVPLNKTTS